MHSAKAFTTEPLGIVATDGSLNPTRLEKPAFLLNFPFSYSASVANNVWMEEIESEKREVDMRKAVKQFLEVYHFMAAESLVYILPAPASCALQDLVFTANLGIVLEHVSGKNSVVVSNYASEPRVRETAFGVSFFKSLGYEVHVAPHHFEGEAELKHLHDNVYVGGYGQRSAIETYEWMERTFGMQVVKLEEVDPYLYHLDCSIFPITRDTALVCTELFSKEEVAEIDKHTNIIDVTADEAYSGICNSVRLSNILLNSSHIHDLKAGTEEYQQEVAKNRKLEDIAATLGFELSFFNLSEYHKSGALLSCMVMHLNRNSYQFTLL
jgi:N-dimethylarginine dimethylaminohydrolase